MDVTHGTVWTIGHSNRPSGAFLALLQAHGIALVADVRSAPSSRRCPQYNQDSLRSSLAAHGIGYAHLPLLGGHRPRQRDVPRDLNAAWTNSSFGNYADYAMGEPFRHGLAKLQALATETRVAYMCAEAVPWRCHRMIVSDHLTLAGWQVRHITNADRAPLHIPGKWGAHPVLRDGVVTYPPQWQQLTLGAA